MILISFTYDMSVLHMTYVSFTLDLGHDTVQEWRNRTVVEDTCSKT